MSNNNVYYREAGTGWITCSQCGASVSPEHGARAPCGCGSKASMFRKGVVSEPELTESDLIGVAEATTRATIEALQGGADDSSQSSAKLALRKGRPGSILWQTEKNRIDGIRLRSRAAEDHMEAQSIAIEHGVAGVVRLALGGVW